jgi:hypothetical protein
MMVWSADEVHLNDDDVHVGIGATAGEFLARCSRGHATASSSTSSPRKPPDWRDQSDA